VDRVPVASLPGDVKCGGKEMRGFRPSYFRAMNDDVDEIEQDKQENLQAYIDRVRQGLPLFEDQPASLSVSAELAGGWHRP